MKLVAIGLFLSRQRLVAGCRDTAFGVAIGKLGGGTKACRDGIFSVATGLAAGGVAT